MINTEELITYSSDLPDWVCAKGLCCPTFAHGINWHGGLFSEVLLNTFFWLLCRAGSLDCDLARVTFLFESLAFVCFQSYDKYLRRATGHSLLIHFLIVLFSQDESEKIRKWLILLFVRLLKHLRNVFYFAHLFQQLKKATNETTPCLMLFHQ